MADQCDLQININGQQTFFLNQKIVSSFSGKLRKMIKQEKKITQMKNMAFIIEDFPGGSNGFELVTRFCYNSGNIPITIENVSQLYCASVHLGMTEKLKSFNLVNQIETFLEGMFYWSWDDVLICLKNCEDLFCYADNLGLVDKLITTLLAKIAQNSDNSLILSSNYSSSSSPECTMINLSHPYGRSNSSAKTTPDESKPLSSTSNNSSSSTTTSKAWWFDDLATLSPLVIEKVIRNLDAYGSDNNSLLLTKFLVHYLKIAVQGKKSNPRNYPKSDYTGIVDSAVYGVILMGKAAFSCRALFGVLRLVSGFGLSKVCSSGLEKLIGSMLDSAKLDDLLVSGNTDTGNDQGVYDVNLVIRLIRVFVQCESVSLDRLIKVGKLIDQYLAEISPDQNLRISKFIGVAQSLPDLARDCFDGVYRAIDIYLESHPTLPFEDRSRLCRCLNYEKLTLEACKDLAKNPRIPPRVAVQALASQKQVNYEPPTQTDQLDYYYESPTNTTSDFQMVLYNKAESAQDYEKEDDLERTEDVKLNIQRMQCRVLELEKLCKEMKGQMSKLVSSTNSKTINSSMRIRSHRLC